MRYKLDALNYSVGARVCGKALAQARLRDEMIADGSAFTLVGFDGHCCDVLPIKGFILRKA